MLKRSGSSPRTGIERVDERLVDQAVSHLKRVVVTGQVETIVQVGEYLIENFYGGVEQARSRSPQKAASLARLAGRAEEFGMTEATLGYVVPVTLAARELGAPLAGRLGVSRLRALLPVRDAQQRRLVAESAVSSGWTVERVKARVRQVARPHAGGRPELPNLERLVGRVRRAIGEDAEAASLRVGLDRLSPARARELLAEVNRIQADVERVEKLLQKAAVKAED